jgi:TM2 domain-containing membrane protein YozV
VTGEFCPRCGAQRSGALRYCGSCGLDFEDPQFGGPTTPQTVATPIPAPPMFSAPVPWAPPPERPSAGPVGWGPLPGSAVAPTGGLPKDRLVAITFALLLGSVGVHKFYLGKVAQGILYLVFCWTYIPAIIAWVEGIIYLRTSNEEWAAKYPGPVVEPNSTAIGCLWVLAILPVLFIVALISLIFLGSQVSTILSNVGNSI